MSFCAANPVCSSQLFPSLAVQANNSLERCNGGGGIRSSWGVATEAKLAAIVADLPRQDADEDFALDRVCRCVSRLDSGTAFRAFHAPGGISLFCFGCAALLVTVSLQILFGKDAEKISPEPP